MFSPLTSADAYVACGGNADKTGCVNRHVIGKIIEGKSGLEVDINRMVDEADKDDSGEMEFGEFEDLLKGDADIFWSVDYFDDHMYDMYTKHVCLFLLWLRWEYNNNNKWITN